MNKGKMQSYHSRFISVCFILLIPICIIGCNRGSSFSDLNRIYNENKSHLNQIKDSLISTHNFISVTRLVCDEINSKYSFGNCKGLRYSIVFKNSNIESIFEIVLDENSVSNEDAFWIKNFNEIRDSLNSIALSEYLKKNEFSPLLFSSIISFMRKHKIYYIKKTYPLLIFHFTADDGLLYNDRVNFIPQYGSPSELKEVDINWYYFKTYNY